MNVTSPPPSSLARPAFGGTLSLVPSARGACFEVLIPLAVREKRELVSYARGKADVRLPQSKSTSVARSVPSP